MHVVFLWSSRRLVWWSWRLVTMMAMQIMLLWQANRVLVAMEVPLMLWAWWILTMRLLRYVTIWMHGHKALLAVKTSRRTCDSMKTSNSAL